MRIKTRTWPNRKLRLGTRSGNKKIADAELRLPVGTVGRIYHRSGRIGPSTFPKGVRYFREEERRRAKKNKKKARLEVRWLGNRDGLSQRFWNFRGLRLLWNCRFGPWFWTGVPAFLVLCVVFHFSIFQFFHFWKLGDWVWPSPVGPWWL